MQNGVHQKLQLRKLKQFPGVPVIAVPYTPNRFMTSRSGMTSRLLQWRIQGVGGYPPIYLKI